MHVVRWWGRVLTLCAILLVYCTLVVWLQPTTAHAETWNHRAYASLAKNSPAKAKYVQGVAYDGNKYAYVVKQNCSKHQSIWRVNMNTGSRTKMTLSSTARKRIYHGNDLAYAKVGGVEYLFVAPCKAHSKYLYMLKVSGKKVTYVKGFRFSFTPKVSAVTIVRQQGTIITAIVGKGSKLWMTRFDTTKRKVTKNLGRVYGYRSNQGITYADGYVYTCDGGYTTRLGNVRKYKLVKSGNHYNLRSQWVRQIKGEPEGAFVDRHGKVCVALEGKWHWNFSDRIVRWER